MSYTVVVEFEREWGDDESLVRDKPEYFGLTLREAFKRQFAAELQEAYDSSEGALAGHFNVVKVFCNSAAQDQDLNDPIKDKDPVRAALQMISWARDYHAEHCTYPEGTVGDDQNFDDWAAEVADMALRGEIS